MKKLILLILLIAAVVTVMAVANQKRTPPMKQVRTFLPYTFPIDPMRIFVNGDMDLSYALASTLVEWNDKKEISTSLAIKWEIIEPNTYRFKLRPGLSWSDGSPLKSSQIKASFLLGFEKYPDDLRSAIKIIKSIECPSDDIIDFVLNVPAVSSNLLGKLTEPQYGILYVENNHNLRLDISSGPFLLLKNAKEEVVLRKNSHWPNTNEKMADEIIVRNPPVGFDHQRILIDNPWGNLAQTYSLFSNELIKEFESQHFSNWTHNLDRVYLFAASKSLAKNNHQDLIRFLDRNLSREKITTDLNGYTLADQVMPIGYALHDSKYRPEISPVSLPAEFLKRPVKILCPGSLMTAKHVQNLKAELTRVLKIEPIFECIPLAESGARRVKGDFDLYMGSYGIADPDPEGFLSYYFEGDAPVIPKGQDNFVKRLDRARHEQNAETKLTELRSLLTDAKDRGYILPLLHVSTVGLARPELDLSHVPKGDESITFSKIRFHDLVK